MIANLNTMKGDIEFKDVWFRYPTRKDNWVLQGISFKIRSMENVGLVGESGAGKSTITQLLYRFYDPQFGEIFIDGVNIRDYDIQSLRRCFGLVQQEPLLFNYSI
ncbi:MAG: ATP-binding cassette domain-containing protein [Streptococcus sp.]|nr:ATP-binding cassette domain-containing protein [Streptococcus sp.]